LAAFLTLPAIASGQDTTKKVEPPKQSAAQLLEELKALKDAVAKLQAEIKELRANKTQAETREQREERLSQVAATQTYARTVAATFLDLVLDRAGEGKDAVRMLTKDLRADLGLNPHFYTQVLGDNFKSKLVDSYDFSPNGKEVILKGYFKGMNEKKEVAVPFVLRMEMEGDQWRVSLFRVYFNKK
jgi:hypothetical protein